MTVKHVYLAILILSTVSALYSDSSPVIKLTEANFKTLVLDSDDLWLVEFFAPWCGHCKKLAPQFEKAAKALKGIAKLGAVDMTTDGAAGNNYGISGYPTLKFFGEDKNSPKDYESGRTAKDISIFIAKQVQSLISTRLGVKIDTQLEEEKKEENKPEEPEIPINDEDVVLLSDNDFEDRVFGSDDLWFIEFYAPWCGHCKKLAPEWAKAATALKGQAKFGKVDSTQNSRLHEKYEIKSYPTIKVFLPGVTQPEEYNGGRDGDILIKEAFLKLDMLGKAPVIPQLASLKVLNNTCEKEVCLIAFLPHIYDSSAAERNRYIGVIQESAKKNRGKPIKYLWAQAGDYYKFEQIAGLGFGFPSVIGISLTKSRYGLMKSSYSLEEIEVFIRKLMGGNIPLTEYKSLPELKEITPWDGQDHTPEIINEDL